MKHISLPPSRATLAALMLAGLLCHPVLAEEPAGKTVTLPAGAPPPAKYSFLDPVEDFIRDSILRPNAPFELVPGKDPNGWAFSIEPYGWLPGLSGNTGVGGIDTHIDFDAKSLLQHLDWGVFSRGEARKGRWGVLGDGFFVQLSGGGDPPGSIYKNLNFTLQQGLAQLALAYRVIDARAGYLDIYTGARYNYLGLNGGMGVDEDAVNEIADEITEAVAVHAGVARALSGDLLPEKVAKFLSSKKQSGVFAKVRPQYRALVAATVKATSADVKGQLTPELRNAVSKAKQDFSEALAKSIENSLPTSFDGDRWWIDPIVGFRGQVNFTRWLFLVLQADFGGFGAGSQFTCMATGAVGINYTRNIFSEIGWRYFYTDYDQDDFLYQIAQSGLFASLGFKF